MDSLSSKLRNVARILREEGIGDELLAALQCDNLRILSTRLGDLCHISAAMIDNQGCSLDALENEIIELRKKASANE